MGDMMDWKNPATRQRMIHNMANVLKSKGVSHIDMQQLTTYENGISLKSASADDYKSKLSRLIQHLVSNSARMAPQQMAPQQMAPQQMAPQQMAPQPMAPQQIQPGVPPMHMHMHNQSMQGGSQMSSSHMPPQMGQPPMIPNQPMHSNQPSMMNMGGPSPYSGENSFNQSPAPSQPQVPNMFNNRPAYSPGGPPSGVPIPSPTQAMMRAPQPSPSMNMNINTPAPANSGAMTPQEIQAPSPASSFPPSQGQPSSVPSSDQDQQYMDKIRELSGYIEPLKKMLGKMAKEGKQNQQDYNKLCVLLNLLQPNNNKTSYDMLCRCEEVLKKLKLPTYKVTKETIHESSSHWCQPLLTAVAETINTTGSKNVLRQTFAPATHALYGPNLCSSQKLQQSSSRKRKLPVPSESGPHKFPPVPHLIQGELARLDSRFRVSRDKSQLEDSDHNNGLGLRLQCVIDDKKLASVPPLKFTLPDDYPDSNPLCDMNMELCDTSQLFIDVKKRFAGNLKKLQNKYSMTALLETWLTSIKQTCLSVRKEMSDPHPPVIIVS